MGKKQTYFLADKILFNEIERAQALEHCMYVLHENSSSPPPVVLYYPSDFLLLPRSLNQFLIRALLSRALYISTLMILHICTIDNT